MTTTTTDLIPAGTWGIDESHSSASFEVDHGGVSIFRGSFKPIRATLVARAGEAAELDGSVAVEGIGIDDENIRPHLLSPEFFDAERNPEIRFRSTAIEGTPDELTVAGELSMAGAALPVTATGRVRGPVEFAPGMAKISLSLETTIDRRAFGMDWQMELPGGNQALGNDVRLTVELEFLKG